MIAGNRPNILPILASGLLILLTACTALAREPGRQLRIRRSGRPRPACGLVALDARGERGSVQRAAQRPRGSWWRLRDALTPWAACGKICGASRVAVHTPSRQSAR